MTHPLSHEAQRACRQALASAADNIGWHKPLNNYNQAQVMQVIEAITLAYEASIRGQTSPAGHKVALPLDGFENDSIPF
ncbi:DUF6511 domain-containing protein [Lysobacter sp. ISL-50]|uniref:DUF6511 domain-containing protein n=1 Tax=unclassified Lysobacter TaxID=2635362 RepID=UPI001BE6AF26|nr:hypothetical protein [Lysobacter sp. ISL-42]MBT2749860.1 hypothetical protein [Lysobacter sp. ISL-50]MBT2781188.1 hypothetical protein [Lysobacter sp. ISL-52]